MQVSVRQLKNELSKYLHMVQSGETVIVTSHHVPLAKLLPIPAANQPSLQQLVLSGLIKWNGKKPKGGKLLPKIKGKTASERILEDRR